MKQLKMLRRSERKKLNNSEDEGIDSSSND